MEEEEKGRNKEIDDGGRGGTSKVILGEHDRGDIETTLLEKIQQLRSHLTEMTWLCTRHHLGQGG